MSLKLKNTFVYTILGFLPLSFSLIFTPFYTQYLSKSDYGLLNLFTIISSMIVPFFSLGIDQAFGFLYWDYNTDKKKFGELIATTLSLVFVIGLVMLGIGLVIGPWLIATFIKNGAQFSMWPFLLLSLIYPSFIIANRILLYYYRNDESVKKYSLLNLSALVVVTVGSVLTVIYFKLGSSGAVQGRTIGFCAIIFSFLIYEIKRMHFAFNKGMAQSLIRLGWPLFFSTLIGSFAYLFDRIIVEQTGNLETLGLYGFSVTIASVIEIFMAALGNSMTPSIYKTLLQGDVKHNENTDLQLFIFVYSIVGAVVTMTAIITPFIRLFISPNFHESILYIPILCLSFVPRTFSQIFSLKFYKKKKTVFVLLLNISYLLSIALLGLLLNFFMGLKGVITAVFLSALINMFASSILSRRVDSFPFRFSKLYALSGTVAISMLLLQFIPQTFEYPLFLYLVPLLVFLLFSFVFLRHELNRLKDYFLQRLKEFQ